MQFFFLLPNHSLPYLKVVQGECKVSAMQNESQKTFVLLDKLQFGPLGARAYNPRPPRIHSCNIFERLYSNHEISKPQRITTAQTADNESITTNRQPNQPTKQKNKR